MCAERAEPRPRLTALLTLLTLLWLGLLGLHTSQATRPDAPAPLQESLQNGLLERLVAEPEGSLARRVGQMLTHDPLWQKRLREPPPSEARPFDPRLLHAVAGWFAVSAAGGVLVWLGLPWWAGKGGRELPAVDLELAWLLFVSWQLLHAFLAPLLSLVFEQVGLAHVSAITLSALGSYAVGYRLLRPALNGVPLRPRHAIWGVPAFWAAGPAVLVASWLSGMLLGGDPASRNPALDLFRDAGGWDLIQLAFLVIVAGPLWEELLFRGVLYGSLRRRLGPVAAALISAFLFAAVHADPPGVLPYMALGLVFATLYEKTGSLAASWLAHAIWNAQTFCLIWLLSQPG